MGEGKESNGNEGRLGGQRWRGNGRDVVTDCAKEGVKILGIESSCDETAAAVVVDGRKILSSVVASQIDIHRKYGGVVPELASREHLRQIVPVVREALAQAGLRFEELDAIGVTQGPGLVGSLLVGITYGKTLATALGSRCGSESSGWARSRGISGGLPERKVPRLPACA